MTTTTTEHRHPRTATARRRSRWTAMTAVAVLAFAPLAACGGDDTDASAADASSDATGAGSGDMQAFQDCLAENGVEMGGPPADGADGEQPAAPDQEAMAQAQEACGDLMPEGGPGGAGGPGGMGGEEMQAWTDCLADNGVEMTQPDRGELPSDGETPDPGDMPDAGEGGTPFGLDTSDPEVAAAVEACADLQPEMGQPPSDGTAGGGDTSTGNTSSDGSEA